MEKMAGPMNPSTNDECALLIDGFDSSPCLMMPYNPVYYSALLERAGLKKAKDLYAYLLEQSTFVAGRLSRIAAKVITKEPGLRVRPINLRRLDQELMIIKDIYNHAWSKNWGFVPLTEAEIETRLGERRQERMFEFNTVEHGVSTGVSSCESMVSFPARAVIILAASGDFIASRKVRPD
jgi:hypothetical protein